MKMKPVFKIRLAASVGLAAMTMAATTSVLAQEVTSELDDVIVTAQKRSERLLDVPMSISVTSGEQLTQAGITSTSELQQISPGLVTVSNGFAFTPAIRGVSSIGSSPGDETNVSMYLDDVYMGAPLAGIFELMDIQRIEVLKGPQGTLFGRNATGGAVRIVTLPPSFTPGGQVRASYGFDFNEIALGGYVTGPLTDEVAGSLNLYYTDNDGYVDGVGPNVGRKYAANETFSTRAKLLFDLSDDLSITLSADYSDRSDNSAFVAAPKDRRSGNEHLPGIVLAAPFEYAGGTDPIIKTNAGGVGADVQWDINEGLSLRSITAYRSVEGYFQADTDRTNQAVGSLALIQDQDSFSQEFNLSGAFNSRLNWIGGLYFYHAVAGNPYFKAFAGDRQTNVVAVAYTDEVETTSYAAFGELTWDVMDRLHVTLGGRYTSESKAFDYADLVRAAGIRTSSVKETWESPTYRLVARYDISDDFNVYASASNGFKSGVYNAYSLPAIPVEPEEIDALEIGVKGKVGGVTVTAAAFSYDYTNIQVQSQTVVAGGAFIIALNNAAEAKIQGYELSTSGFLTEKLAFDVGISALPKAEYENYRAAQVFIPNPVTGGATSTVPYDASGSRIIRSPKLQGTARLTYSDTIVNGDFVASANYTYNDGFYWQAGNLTPQDQYGVLNARVSWTEPKGVVTYSVWGNNLTDETYSLYGSSGGLGMGDAFAKPRQLGVAIAAKF